MKNLVIILLISLLLLAGCIERREHEDLIDMIAINDVYLYYNEEETESLDYKNIDKVLGEVLFTIKGNTTNGGYKPKNWDATFLKVGTEIYSVQGYSNIELVYANGKVYGPYSLLQRH